MRNNDKLYIVTHKRLFSGAKMAQTNHAAFQFAKEHRKEMLNWMNSSNYICILDTDNEQELESLLLAAKKLKIKSSEFREPDLDNQLTAIALEPGQKSKALCAHLKLAE